MDDIPVLPNFENTPEELASADHGEKQKKVRRPPNAFFLYCVENRSKVREQNPDMPNLDVTKALAEMWKNLTESERQPFKEQAKIKQSDFKQDHPDYKYQKKNDSKKNSSYDLSSLLEIPDVIQLAALPPEELKQCITLLYGQILMSQQNINGISTAQNISYGNNDEQYGGDVFQNNQ